MKKSEMLVTITLPGKTVDVRNDNGSAVVTVALPCDENPVPVMSQAAIERMTAGLSDMDADVLVERVGHFAFVESMRARIRMGGIVQRVVS